MDVKMLEAVAWILKQLLFVELNYLWASVSGLFSIFLLVANYKFILCLKS